MVKFNKISNYQSEIIINDNVVGVMELVGQQYYEIEIDYFRFSVPVSEKSIIIGMIEKVFKAFRDRERRAKRPLRPYSQFKTLS